MAKKKKDRVDVSSDQGDLSNNPFAGLGAGMDLPEMSSVQKEPKAQILDPYTVTKTRKGGWPVRMERRGNKVVTVISSISGDTKVLLKALQKLLGVGGKAEGDKVQIQGDHVQKIIDFLDAK